MRFLKPVLFVALVTVGGSVLAAPPTGTAMALTDTERGREVPVQLYFPSNRAACTVQQRCPVTLLSPGYGVRHTSYSFVANALANEGHLVVAVQHDLPSDPPLPAQGDLVTIRTPMWQRGAANLRFVKAELSRAHPEYDWSKLTLVGHSNGGDISSLLLRDNPAFATTLITLDNRRVALPRSPAMRVLSIRGSDFEADPGVLPLEDEQASSSICVVEVPGSRHNDMFDDGPQELKSRINALIHSFRHAGRCGV